MMLIHRRSLTLIKMCGCNRNKPATYEVYEDKQPHCLECMLDAIECNNQVLVRRIDDAAWDPNQSK